VAFVALVGVMLWYRAIPGWEIIFLPFLILLAIATSLGVGLWLSALTAIYRDFRFIVPFIVQVDCSSAR